MSEKGGFYRRGEQNKLFNLDGRVFIIGSKELDKKIKRWQNGDGIPTRRSRINRPR